MFQAPGFGQLWVAAQSGSGAAYRVASGDFQFGPVKSKSITLKVNHPPSAMNPSLQKWMIHSTNDGKTLWQKRALFLARSPHLGEMSFSSISMDKMCSRIV